MKLLPYVIDEDRAYDLAVNSCTFAHVHPLQLRSMIEHPYDVGLVKKTADYDYGENFVSLDLATAYRDGYLTKRIYLTEPLLHYLVRGVGRVCALCKSTCRRGGGFSGRFISPMDWLIVDPLAYGVEGKFSKWAPAAPICSQCHATFSNGLRLFSEHPSNQANILAFAHLMQNQSFRSRVRKNREHKFRDVANVKLVALAQKGGADHVSD